MEFSELVEIIKDEPVFDTGLLLAGDINPREIRRQLSRWNAAGKIYQLRRGLYCLAPPFQKVNPPPIPGRQPLDSGILCQLAVCAGVLRHDP
jgi:hypothetical protein